MPRTTLPRPPPRRWTHCESEIDPRGHGLARDGRKCRAVPLRRAGAARGGSGAAGWSWGLMWGWAGGLGPLEAPLHAHARHHIVAFCRLICLAPETAQNRCNGRDSGRTCLSFASHMSFNTCTNDPKQKGAHPRSFGLPHIRGYQSIQPHHQHKRLSNDCIRSWFRLSQAWRSDERNGYP